MKKIVLVLFVFLPFCSFSIDLYLSKGKRKYTLLEKKIINYSKSKRKPFVGKPDEIISIFFDNKDFPEIPLLKETMIPDVNYTPLYNSLIVSADDLGNIFLVVIALVK